MMLDRRLEPEEHEQPYRDLCVECGEPIRIATDTHYGEEYIMTEDGPVHWECWNQYGEKLKQEAK